MAERSDKEPESANKAAAGPSALSTCHLVTLSPCHPRWLHWWAIATACAALPLVALGAVVTTKDAGMADPKGFRAPWHLVNVSLEENMRLFVEHRHRLAGMIVGTCCIVLAVGLWFGARRQPYRSLGLVALVAVSMQGVLGIYRVDLETQMGRHVGLSFAIVHGCVAQLVFATLVGVAVATSPTWFGSAGTLAAYARSRRLALAMVVVVYVQIVFGAVVRHVFDRSAQRFHVLLAFVVVVLAARLIKTVWETEDRPSKRAAALLGALLVVQPVLGVEAWLRRFGTLTLPDLVPPSLTLDLVRSGHHVVGTLIFSTAVALALLRHRPALSLTQRPFLDATPRSAAPLEGAA